MLKRSLVWAGWRPWAGGGGAGRYGRCRDPALRPGLAGGKGGQEEMGFARTQPPTLPREPAPRSCLHSAAGGFRPCLFDHTP